MPHKYTYNFTYTYSSGDIVTGEAEVEVHYLFSPGTPARINYNENDHPADPPEIEITDVLVEEVRSNKLKTVYSWRPATTDEFETYSEHAMDKHFDFMVEEARSELNRGPDD